MFKIANLVPNRFKYQTVIFELLNHNYNHKQEFGTQKVVTHHCFGNKLKLPKYSLLKKAILIKHQ